MSKTKLQIGDTVKIKYHTEHEKDNYPFGWSPIMDCYEGQEFIIKEISHKTISSLYGCNMTSYYMDYKINPFAWHKSSLIKIENKQYQTF